MMSDQVFWFATRSAGILCWFAATTSVVVGLLMTTRALGRRPTLPWLLDLHRFLSWMALAFLGVHLVTLWLDPFVKFGFSDLVMPFAARVPGLSSWSLFLGVLAAWLLTAIQLSSLVRNYLQPRTWHTIHLTSYGVMLAGAIHGVEAGSDTDNPYLLAAAISVLAATLMLTVTRLSRLLTERKRRYDEALTLEPDELDDEDDYPDYEWAQVPAGVELLAEGDLQPAPPQGWSLIDPEDDDFHYPTRADPIEGRVVRSRLVHDNDP
jgi:predicted ferric reductase